MSLKNQSTDDLTKEIIKLIVNLRRNKNTEVNWPEFRKIIESDTEFICSVLNTRWLISIADTYTDYGNDIEKRNALYISMLGNFEKLSATRLLIYDLQLNKNKLDLLKKNRIIPLWDGMYSFNINHGEMTNNLFYRIRTMMRETPALEYIFETVLKRIIINDTLLGNLNLYHSRLIENPGKKSIMKTIGAKISYFLKNYRLL